MPVMGLYSLNYKKKFGLLWPNIITCIALLFVVYPKTLVKVTLIKYTDFNVHTFVEKQAHTYWRLILYVCPIWWDAITRMVKAYKLLIKKRNEVCYF